MKARVKETGEIVDVRVAERGRMYCDYDFIDSEGLQYDADELEYDPDPDYWTRLEHQYAGMAMQGMLNNSLLITGLLKVNKSHEDVVAEVTGTAIRYAHALVEKLKEE